MGMNASCCQMRESAPAVAVIPLFSPVHQHHLAFFAQHAGLHTAPERRAQAMSAFHRAAPAAPPGLGAVLRI